MDVAQTLARALQLHNSGDFSQARQLYRLILSGHPNHADALHLLGMVMLQEGDHQQAERLIQRAISIHPGQSVYFSNLAIVYRMAGKNDRAIESAREALELSPGSIEALNILATALFGNGQVTEAIDCFKKAILLRPEAVEPRANLLAVLNLPTDSPAGCHALGDLFHEAGKFSQAVTWYKSALAKNPDSVETLNNLGNALFAGGNRDEAVLAYQRALQINPEFARAWNNLANVLSEMGRLDEAMTAYEKAVALQPNAADPLSNFANLLRDAGQHERAMQLYQQALAINPNHAVTHNNVGNAYCENGQWQLAIESYGRAIAIKPDYADAMNNLGTALEEIGQRDRAMECYRHSLMLEPRSVSAPWNIALLQLLLGDYERGWRGYEIRWKQKKQSKARRNFPQPMPTEIVQLKGKRILLHAEQGFGDAIQFSRYAPMVADAGAEVIVECPAALVRLFGSLRGVKQVVARGEALPDFDLQCPFMTLPMLFGTTLSNIPAKVPYLAASHSDIENWETRLMDPPSRSLRYPEKPDDLRQTSGSSEHLRDRLGPSKPLRVGLVWAGQSTHQKDRHRSLCFADFEPLLSLDNIQFVSLQVGEASVQCKPPVIDWTADLKDFSDTAAVISQLDLVISVDTAVCHLAGAMAKPVWILLAYHPDWRWLLDRTDSPWYPTARLFRQTVPGDWSAPLTTIRQQLHVGDIGTIENQ